ncbi:restriction endonuclease subunit S [Billgrantia aerodenitrificans]|uniref:Type I restriction modification DNA specificity domain-containing protein n=1 Tax=Billgrantia aerodenitrificans TaxID=2733483 RepID=A0ABS9AQZ2_9GAMM|nr:restriction endonuclease subunit S [Halomonas aerodenitrificans]MCE8024108.1 hypothetical protein [Halomonas aerodenitrificans]
MPKNWTTCTVEDLADLVRGVTYTKADAAKKLQDGHAPLLRSNNINISINHDELVFVKEERIGEAQWLCDGDVLIAMSSGSSSLVGKAAQAKIPPRETFGAFCSVLRPFPLICKRYFGWFFQTSMYRQNVSADAKGSSINNLKRSHVLSIGFPLAPANEQLRIVDKIESLFAQLDHGEAGLRDVQKLLARYRQSVLKAAVTGQLTADWRAENADRLESGHDLLERILQARRENWQGRGKYKEPAAPDTRDLPELPEGWVWASVDQMVRVFRNGLSKKPVAEKNQYPILRISAVRPMSVTLNDLRYYSPADTEDVSSYWVEKGDLLFTRYSGSAQFVGVCGQMRDSVSVLHPDKLIKLRVVDTPELCRDFLELAWNAGVTRAHIASNIKTTSGQQGIAGGDIKSAPFPLPPADEQVVIAERVWDVFEKMERLQSHCQAELARSAALRQSVLKDAFAGKLVPQNPDDEPASELLARIRAERDAAAPKKRTRKKATA